MKKIKFLTIFILAVAFTTTFTSCGGDDSPSKTQDSDQFSVKVGDEVIQDGTTWTTTAVGENGNMPLSITNLTDETLYLRIKVTSLSDNVPAENNIELCMGSCYFSIQQGMSYPTDVPYPISAGATSPDNAAHVKNNDNRNGDVTIDLKIYQTDAQGNELPNKQTLSFTYFYDAP